MSSQAANSSQSGPENNTFGFNPSSEAVPFFADAMTLEDLPAVMAIDRTAFPIPWPEQAYRHELLENPNAYFIVVRLRISPQHGGNGKAPEHSSSAGRSSWLQRLVGTTAKRPTQAMPIIGFAGLWMFVDEAHISTIASHVDWRGQGVGELLLLSLLREAQRRAAIFATLEVRVSNIVAQNLYRKYGFVEVGRRKHYYHDNDEDALIMTVQDFIQPLYQARLDALERTLWNNLTGRKVKISD